MTRSASPSDAPRDSVDRLLESWSQSAPGLDLSPVGVVLRLERIRKIIDVELEVTFAQYGLNGPDFAALVTLRRLARPGGVPQSLLMRELNLTSGTISVRVERLCARGLTRRSADPKDHRNSLIELTDAGRRLFDRVAPAHAATEHRLLAALSNEQRTELASLLRRLLVSFEGSTADDSSTPRLGLSLASAHTTLALRRAAGLPDVVGLLVHDVEGDGPAARAGIRTGDVLIRADDHELRSVTSLHAAAKRARTSAKLRLTGVRGVRTRFEAVLDLRDGSGDERWPMRTAAAEAPLHTI